MRSQCGRVAIIDYGMGNLFSVKQACLHIGVQAEITADKDDIPCAAAIILPGVGAFGQAMHNLDELGFIQPILDYIRGGRPFMGICLGMQLLFTESEEFGTYPGLGVISGKVCRFPAVDLKTQAAVKVPQVGWNQIRRQPLGRGDCWNGSALERVTDGEYMYFVHSFFCRPDDAGVVLSVSEYGGIDYCSSLKSGNVFASQFHPEKSAEIGLEIYRTFFEGANLRS